MPQSLHLSAHAVLLHLQRCRGQSSHHEASVLRHPWQRQNPRAYTCNPMDELLPATVIAPRPLTTLLFSQTDWQRSNCEHRRYSPREE